MLPLHLGYKRLRDTAPAAGDDDGAALPVVLWRSLWLRGLELGGDLGHGVRAGRPGLDGKGDADAAGKGTDHDGEVRVGLYGPADVGLDCSARLCGQERDVLGERARCGADPLVAVALSGVENEAKVWLVVELVDSRVEDLPGGGTVLRRRGRHELGADLARPGQEVQEVLAACRADKVLGGEKLGDDCGSAGVREGGGGGRRRGGLSTVPLSAEP